MSQHDRTLAYDYYECLDLVRDFHDVRRLLDRLLQEELEEDPSWRNNKNFEGKRSQTFDGLIRVSTSVNNRYIAEMVRAVHARDEWMKSVSTLASRRAARSGGRPPLVVDKKRVLDLYDRLKSTRRVGEILGIGRDKVAEVVRESRKKVDPTVGGAVGKLATGLIDGV